MTAINTSGIDINFPRPKTNNDSQGFRDNFASIKINLDAAASEIDVLQNFQQSGANAVSRPIQDKIRESWFSVKDFGAVGDATFAGTGTDDTLAFQRAINAAWSAAQTATSNDYGGTVYVPPGHYLITAPLTIHPSVKLVGGGMYASKIFCPTSFIGRGVLVTDASTAPYSNVPGFPTTISDLAVLGGSGGALSTSGIYCNKNGCFVQNVWVAGFSNGIVLNNTDCFVSNFASELNTYGIVALQPSCTITNGVLHDNDTGLYVQNIIRMTATGGTSTTITFPFVTTNPTDTSVTQQDDAFNGWLITIVSGTGAGQQRVISDYVGSTRTATVSSPWDVTPNSTSVFVLDFDNGSLTISDVRIQPSNQVGIYVYRSRRVQISNCSATQTDDANFSLGALRIQESIDVTVTNFRATSALYDGAASSSKDGIVCLQSTLVNLVGGVAGYWRNGLVIDGCQNIAIDGFQSNSNTLRGLFINGGSQITVNGGTYSNNGTVAGIVDCGIESINSVASAVHSINGVQCDGLGGKQNYGVIATLSGSGRTLIGGGTSAINNVSAPYLLTDSIGSGLIFTNGAFPTTRSIPVIASASTITIPAWAANGGKVAVSGTATINTITASGFTGAEVTLIFQSIVTVVDGSNLRLAGNFTSAPEDTLTLACDGINWFEISRTKIQVADIVNVLNFGADPTGVVDSTAAFNLATKAATQGTGNLDSNIPGGVYVPAGIYKISGTVFVHKGQHLYGVGSGGSKIDATGMTGFTGPVFRLGFSSTGVQDLGDLPAEISGLWVNGGPSNHPVIDCSLSTGTRRGSIRDIILNQPGIGIRAGGVDVRMNNVQVDGGNIAIQLSGNTHQLDQISIYNTNYGIYTIGSECSDVIVNNLSVGMVKYAGILFDTGVAHTNLNFTGCNFVLNEQFPTFVGFISVACSNARNVTFNNCDFSNMRGPAYYHQDGTVNVVTFNNCTFRGTKSVSTYFQSTTSYAALIVNDNVTFNTCTFNNLSTSPITIDGGAAVLEVQVNGGAFYAATSNVSLFAIGGTAPEPQSVISAYGVLFYQEGQVFPDTFSNSWNLATDHAQVINGAGAGTTASLWPVGEGSRYFINTSGQAARIRLPRTDSLGNAKAKHGARLTFIDYSRNWATNNVTFLCEDNQINGSASNLVVNTNGATITFTFNGFTNDWITSAS